MLLSRLIAGMPDASVSGAADIEICDIAYDSRQVTPGALFVAVPSVGGTEDSGGVRFVAEAARRGAAAVVIPRGQQVDAPVVVQVPDARAALADLGAAFFGEPSRSLALFAVTGTDGKTTTTYLLEQILARAGYRTGMMGTVEVKIGDTRQRNPDRMTTPESLDVQRLLRTMVDAGVTHVTMEASSHALALQRLRGCSFTACALTNITADHVEFHGCWERYFEAKASLFTDLATGRPAVLNRDDDHFERLASLLPRPPLTYGVDGPADITAIDAEPHDAGTCFTLQAGGASAPVALALPGRFNVANALAAAGLALAAGLPIQGIADGLSHAEPPPGRFERVMAGQSFDVLVDYAHTMHAFRSVLATVRGRTSGRVIAVFGSAGDRDRSKRPVLARIAREYADLAIVTNEDPFGEPADAIIDEILSGVRDEERSGRFVREPERRSAIYRAVSAARPGDAVVILGKGHEQNIVAGGTKEPWSDVAEARAALEALT